MTVLYNKTSKLLVPFSVNKQSNTAIYSAIGTQNDKKMFQTINRWQYSIILIWYKHIMEYKFAWNSQTRKSKAHNPKRRYLRPAWLNAFSVPGVIAFTSKDFICKQVKDEVNYPQTFAVGEITAGNIHHTYFQNIHKHYNITELPDRASGGQAECITVHP